MIRVELLASALVLALVACGDNKASCPLAFDDGDDTGHADPLGASPGEARAGRIREDQLPVVSSGLVTWRGGDFVLANDKVALVIEAAGESDLYDPWGGRPVGLARVEGGALVQPHNFGELFLLTGRSTIVTEQVSVIADGSDGGPAIVRARGKLHPLPFFENLVSIVYQDPYADLEAAIDYELAPGAEHIDVRMRYASARSEETEIPSTLHALMYSFRTAPTVFQPDYGFYAQLGGAPYIAQIEDGATGYAYVPGAGTLSSSIDVSGFLGAFSPGFAIPACGTFDRIHASLVIGGPGLDGVVAAVDRLRGTEQRAIAGLVTRSGAPAPGVHVHAIGVGATEKYLTRATTDANGAYSLHVPVGSNIRLDAFSRIDGIASVTVAGSDAPTIDLAGTGSVRVVATENGVPVPARVQLLTTAPAAQAPEHYGEYTAVGGRLHVAFPVDGDVTLSALPGDYEVVVSRGFEYEVVRQPVTITAGVAVQIDADLERVVDTTGVQCGDFHVHTWRSNDSGDNNLEKVRQAVADGVELPVRSEHEWIADFSAEIAQLGVEAHAAGFGSIELTSFQIWGHMGVFPLTPDPAQPNSGAPRWQTFPTAAEPGAAFTTLEPPAVFEAVRARPEAPVVIINHPRGPTNYFGYVGYDSATGMVDRIDSWDTEFTLVEVFNDADWIRNLDTHVADWFGLLRAGRRITAIGSSDSHSMMGTPVGYPRTCIALGTDDPRALTASHVRDQLAAGHATVSGGIYVDARIGGAGPGDQVTGAGSPMMVDVTVQAATWVDVDAFDVVVDGVIVDTITIMPGDADPTNEVIRWQGQVPVQVQAAGGFVVIAAYGDGALEPVHPGKRPFGVANPIFVVP